MNLQPYIVALSIPNKQVIETSHRSRSQRQHCTAFPDRESQSFCSLGRFAHCLLFDHRRRRRRLVTISHPLRLLHPLHPLHPLCHPRLHGIRHTAHPRAPHLRVVERTHAVAHGCERHVGRGGGRAQTGKREDAVGRWSVERASEKN